MIEFLTDYGLFLLKAITIVVAIVVVLGSAAAASRKAAHHEGLEVEWINRKYEELSKALKRAVLKKS